MQVKDYSFSTIKPRKNTAVDFLIYSNTGRGIEYHTRMHSFFKIVVEKKKFSNMYNMHPEMTLQPTI
jgi:hypothetical protein